MSFLELPADVVPRKKKAVISLWFRVPAKVLDAMTAEFVAWRDSEEGGPRRPLLGIVPLMVFGPSTTDRDFYFPSRLFGTYRAVQKSWSDGSGFPSCAGAGYVTSRSEELQLGANFWSFEQGDGVHAGGGTKRDPSYIGIDCCGDRPALSVNIRMPSTNTAEWNGSYPTVMNEVIEGEVLTLRGGSGSCPGAPKVELIPGYGLCFEAINSFTHTQTYESNADVVLGSEAEGFRTLPGQRAGDYSGENLSQEQLDYQGQEVTPDQWHHLLLSFDFTGKVSTKGVHMEGRGDPGPIETRGSGTGVKMWIAFDDVNLIGTKLSVYSMGGDNSIVTVHGNYVAHDVTYSITDAGNDCRGNNYTITSIQQQPQYDFSPENVSFEGFGLPASSAYLDAIRQVEMAELQMWTDVTLDTGIKKNRRAFVDEDGKPVDPLGTEDDPSLAEKLLGKKPAILLHGSSNWKEGYNTGTLGIKIEMIDGKETITKLPDGQFKPVAGIEQYEPEPALEETTA